MFLFLVLGVIIHREIDSYSSSIKMTLLAILVVRRNLLLERYILMLNNK